MNDEALRKHMKEDADFQKESRERDARLERAIYGDADNGEKGMKQKVDEMYELLIQSRGILSVIGGVRGALLTIVALGAVIALIKGWLKL